ncbi:hypothetical protein CRG86_012520 [Photobacterium leiognathi]|nr:hypothetical protein CRG86_012520 [Photobacterium leiognathi]
MFFILLIFPVFAFASGKTLALDITIVSEQDTSNIMPLIIDKDGSKVVSDVKFTNEIIVLDKPLSKSEPKRVLKQLLNDYISRTSDILNDIESGDISIQNPELKSHIKSTLNANKYYLTKYHDNTVVITRTENGISTTHYDTVDIDLVMSNPDNIIKNSLSMEGGIKRASVENIKNIIRDLRENSSSVDRIEAYVVSPILESNLRRMGFQHVQQGC